jgi:hypothetical protein
VERDPGATFDSEIHRLAGLKQAGLISYTATLEKEEHPQPGITVLQLQSEIRTREHGKTKTRYEEEVLGIADDSGKLVFFGRSAPSYIAPLKQLNPHLYEANADAKTEIAQSVKAAAQDGKRTLLVFGGNWCYDCHVLDAMLHQPDLAPVVRRGYRVLHVDIGRGEKNADLVQKYGINIDKGVPALALLDAKGNEIFVDHGGQFSGARRMDPDTVLAFLEKWAPKREQAARR